MRNLVLFMHVSLDGFVAGPNGEMDWILAGEEMFDLAGIQTDQADTALHGSVTYRMMENYWPTAGDKPDASRHDKQHSAWYNKVEKIVASNTLKEADLNNTKVINGNLPVEVSKLKQKTGKNIVIFGSPGIAKVLIAENMIDDYWLFVNPVLLGNGIALFNGIQNKIKLKIVTTNVFLNGVVCFHYQKATDS